MELWAIFGYLVDAGDLNPGPLQEQQMLITAEPALQPLNSWAIFVLLGSIQVFLAPISGPTIPLSLLLTSPGSLAPGTPLLQFKPGIGGLVKSLRFFFLCRVYVGMGVEVPVIKSFCVETLAVRSWSQNACAVDIPVVTLI